jgi:hypothetical protein
VLTRTRDENIAQLIGTIKAHKIKRSEESSIEEIIKKEAFSCYSIGLYTMYQECLARMEGCIKLKHNL